jgi:hypothetical protein
MNTWQRLRQLEVEQARARHKAAAPPGDDAHEKPLGSLADAQAGRMQDPDDVRPKLRERSRR